MKLTNETLRELYLQDLQTITQFGKKSHKIDTYKTIPVVDQPKQIDPFSNNVYVWSDLHLGHNNIIKYCNRPFPGVDLMNRCLTGNYENIIKPEDIVIFGGDIGFMSDNSINEILDKLPGYKILVYGNHDINHSNVRNLNFDEKHLCFVVDVIDVDFEYQLWFTHHPLETHNITTNAYNVHGHVHEKIIDSNAHFNISVERTGYKPVLLKEYVIRHTQKRQAALRGIPYNG